jgi:hypothetical protein
MRILFAALALSLCAQSAAQQMFKCKDAAGKITYAGQECDQLGLNSAGEIKGRTTVAPAFKPPPAPAATRPPPAAAAKAAVPAAQGAPSSAEASKDPERRCFVVKTDKGTATRCNDVPDDTK